jgi:hypothetical protein
MVFADSNSPVYSRSLRNDGYGADSSPSRGDISRHAFRPTATSAAAIRNVRLTSTPAGRNAQLADVPVVAGNGSTRPIAALQTPARLLGYASSFNNPSRRSKASQRESYRSTANKCHSPGTPFRAGLPRSRKRNPEPATRSLTVRDTRTSLGPASDATRAPM